MNDKDISLSGRKQDVEQAVDAFVRKIERLARNDESDVDDFDPSYDSRANRHEARAEKQEIKLSRRGLEIYLTDIGKRRFEVDRHVSADDVNRFLSELTNWGHGGDRMDQVMVQVSMRAITGMMENARTMTWAWAKAVLANAHNKDQVAAHAARAINMLANWTHMSAIDLGQQAVALLREFKVKAAHKPILDQAAKEKADGDGDDNPFLKMFRE